MCGVFRSKRGLETVAGLTANTVWKEDGSLNSGECRGRRRASKLKISKRKRNKRKKREKAALDPHFKMQ